MGTRVQLRQVSPLTCTRLLKRGEVKRFAKKGAPAPYAYSVGCPACGFITLHFAEAAGFVEDASGQLVATQASLECPHCHVRVVVLDRQFVLPA